MNNINSTDSTDKTNNANGYEPVIGLEIHVQLKTKSKMFSRCSADWFGKAPNTVVCPVSLGLPGALPVPNKKAIEWTVLLGKALNCSINSISKFDRKHYFYPDLPKGYQISQYDLPFCYEGTYKLTTPAGETKDIQIRRVHLEEDTGKLIHQDGQSLVDFNRAGVPLVEIVTGPVFHNSDDVKKFLEELQIIVRYLGISDADMEKGSMRLEPNISLRKVGEEGLPNYKVEVKNINSFRFAKAAIDFEIKRHAEILDNGDVPVQETRGYNENKSMTVSQRVKEEAADYRYFPDPDIPPFELSDEFLKNVDAMLPELPHQAYERLINLGVGQTEAYILTRDPKLVGQFSELCDAVLAKAAGTDIAVDSIPTSIAKLIVNKKLSLVSGTDISTIIDLVFDLMTPKTTDNAALEMAIQEVIQAHPSQVSDYKAGKTTIIMFLVGQVMKSMKGQADAQLVRQQLEEKIAASPQE